MKIQIESIHEGKKPFKCGICEMSFAQKAHLKIHMFFIYEKILLPTVNPTIQSIQNTTQNSIS